MWKRGKKRHKERGNEEGRGRKLVEWRKGKQIIRQETRKKYVEEKRGKETRRDVYENRRGDKKKQGEETERRQGELRRESMSLGEGSRANSDPGAAYWQVKTEHGAESVSLHLFVLTHIVTP